MTYAESELLPLSALQHLAYCERQCALIHLEGLWAENRLTAEGRILHERADSAGGEARGAVRIARGLAIRSLRLGLSGKADVVEFHRLPDTDIFDGNRLPPAAGIRLPGVEGFWRPTPVEYKRGKPKAGPYDEIQVGAQAICLEEMLSVEVPEAFLFYGRNRRRTEVAIDGKLRAEVESTALRLHELIKAGRTPKARYEPAKCDRCSLLDLCLPKSSGRRVRTYIDRNLAELMEE